MKILTAAPLFVQVNFLVVCWAPVLVCLSRFFLSPRQCFIYFFLSCLNNPIKLNIYQHPATSSLSGNNESVSVCWRKRLNPASNSVFCKDTGIVNKYATSLDNFSTSHTILYQATPHNEILLFISTDYTDKYPQLQIWSPYIFCCIDRGKAEY